MRLQILTLAPLSWSAKKIAEEFDCSKQFAKKSKELKASKGILGEPISRAGKKLSKETVTKIVDFYESDSN